MQGYKFGRRNFLKAGGVSALGTRMALAGSPAWRKSQRFRPRRMKRDSPSSPSLPGTRHKSWHLPRLRIIKA